MREKIYYNISTIVKFKRHQMKDLMVPIKQTRICNNCHGNGYLNVVDNQNLTQVKQCWVCESNGEIKNYDQAQVDDFIYNTYYRKRLQ